MKSFLSLFLLAVAFSGCEEAMIDFPPRFGFARIKRFSNTSDHNPWTVETIIAVSGLVIIIGTVLIAGACYKCNQFWDEIREEQQRRAGVTDEKYNSPPPSYS